MKNRNKRRRNIEVAVEIFRIHNFFFPPIFFETRITRGNKSFVSSLPLKKLFKQQRSNSRFVSLSLSLYCPNISITFLDCKSKKMGKKYGAIDGCRCKDFETKRREAKKKQRKPLFDAFFFEYRACCSFGARKGCVALNNWEPNFPVERGAYNETRFFPPLPSFPFHKSNHHSFLASTDVHRFAFIFQRYYYR